MYGRGARCRRGTVRLFWSVPADAEAAPRGVPLLGPLRSGAYKWFDFFLTKYILKRVFFK